MHEIMDRYVLSPPSPTVRHTVPSNTPQIHRPTRQHCCCLGCGLSSLLPCHLLPPGRQHPLLRGLSPYLRRPLRFFCDLPVFLDAGRRCFVP